MAALSSSVTLGLTAPVVGVRPQARAVRAAATPARASLRSAFVSGHGKAFHEGQRLAVAVAPATSGKGRGSRCVTSMAAKVAGYIKLAITAGKANPAPPIGPALGSKGVNIMMFCKEYNARTADQAGMIIPVEITVYEDKSFTFILKTPPASVLLKKAAGVDKGSAQVEKVGSITMEQLAEIATIKLPDLNADKLESAMRIVAGTAANMGITVEGWDMEVSKLGWREEKSAKYGMQAKEFAK
mmetsp:Transcript_6770/g.10431  ORF Transcript_6770/g.10431 Transcript_6770/m.10431 type:complete len:242 (-) Transcript_6770:139-864(-)